VRLLKVHDERFLEVADLDMIDGTPVLDIKPYQPGRDCIFSARRGDRSERIRKMAPLAYREELMRLAVNYHGERCCGAAMAVRMAVAASRWLGGDLRREDISLTLGTDPCMNDALIGITGARQGNGRLWYPFTAGGSGRYDQYALSRPDCTVNFRILTIPGDNERIFQCSESDLFECTLSGK
jgi:hypothetical protein